MTYQPDPCACPCVTPNDIIQEVIVRCDEPKSTNAAQQDMLYLRHVLRVAKNVARDTYCLMPDSATSIVAGQMTYDFPHVFRVDAITVQDASGRRHNLRGVSELHADSMYPNWRNYANPDYPAYYETGYPSVFVARGNTRFSLLPVPNYNALNALVVSGDMDVNQRAGIGDCLPFKDDAIEAIVYGSVVSRAVELTSQEPQKYNALIALYKPMYDAAVQELYQKYASFTPDQRQISVAHHRDGAWNSFGYDRPGYGWGY